MFKTSSDETAGELFFFLKNQSAIKNILKKSLVMILERLEANGGKMKVFNNSSDGIVGEKKSRCLIPVVILKRMEAKWSQNQSV